MIKKETDKKEKDRKKYEMFSLRIYLGKGKAESNSSKE
jgi:hypothetical protein